MRFYVLFLGSVVALGILGCGSSYNPVSSDTSLAPLTKSTELSAPISSKALWGFWQISCDLESGNCKIIPQRGIEYTVDVVAFLQYPKGKPSNLQIKITDKSKLLTEGLLSLQVGLTHPFPGLPQFTGFDVMGVFIGEGSLTLLNDPEATWPQEGLNPVLLNPDGYTRWFNPFEFPPDGTILRFVPGNLGYQNLSFPFAKINAYKYFTDGLDADDNLYEYFQQPSNVANRGFFKPGSVNWRDYNLRFPVSGGAPQIIFQYAVIANWVQADKTLSGDPGTLDVPGDFPVSANAPESFLCHVIDSSTLYSTPDESGGDIILGLEIFDWAAVFEPGCIPEEISEIIIESSSSLIPGNSVSFDPSSLVVLPGSTSISSVFMVEITGCNPSEGSEVFITIVQAKGSFAPNPDLPPLIDAPLSSYQRHVCKVSTEPPDDDFAVIDPNGGEKVPISLSYEIIWNPGQTPLPTVTIEYSKDDFLSDINVIASDAPNTGSFIWDPVPYDPTDTAKIRISENGADADSDISDSYFSIAIPVWFDFQPPVAVEDASVNWHYSWAYKPKDEFSPCITEDTEGEVNVTYYCWETVEEYTSDTNVKSIDGNTWNGIANYFGTVVIMGTPWCTRGDVLKTAPNNIGSGYAAIIHHPLPMPFWSSSFDRIVLPEYNDYSFDCGKSVAVNCELASDSLGHLYFFCDNDSPPQGISCKRSPNPNKFGTAGGSSSMAGATTDTVTTDGEISHVRSWGRIGEGLALVYFTTSNQIRLARTTDAPNNVTWDSSKVVFDGSGYSDVRDPGMFIESNGRIHICFTGLESSTGLYRLLYTRADNIDSDFIPPVIASTSDKPFNDAHVVFNIFNGYPVTAIAFETKGQIRTVICAREDGTIFLPYQEATDNSNIYADCDIWFVKSAKYKYDALIVFDKGEQPYRRVVLQNANIGTL